jgi:hypothetical protein
VVTARLVLLAAIGVPVACGGDVEAEPIECPCGSPLRPSELAQTFEETLAELTDISCDGVPGFRAQCEDGKTVLYIDGGFGHDARYYAASQLVGTSSSSDVYFEGCPSSTFGGSLESVTCELVNPEPLCPNSPYPGGRQLPDSLTIPFADGQLSPWCDPQPLP